MSGDGSARESGEVPAPVAAYKEVLRRVLDGRPSGTRQRLAATLGKNRSFVSQIASPSYPVPIPAQHIEAIFEICRFSQDERKSFLALYARAHPGRLEPSRPEPRMRTLSIAVPDLHDARKNKAVDDLATEFVRKLARTIEDMG